MLGVCQAAVTKKSGSLALSGTAFDIAAVLEMIGVLGAHCPGC